MPQSLHNLLVHLIFSTKNRKNWLDSEIKHELYRYMTSLCNYRDVQLKQIGGMPDHLHLLIKVTPSVLLTKLISELKSYSSKWVKTKGHRYEDFAWQRGYGIFSVSASVFPTCLKYIATQDEHHAQRSYKEELEMLLEKSEVEYDPKYLWS